MDALKFINTVNRVCNEYEVDCANCPIVEFGICGSSADAKELVSVVEEWARVHPVKTRQSEFLKMHPDTILTPDGAIRICPRLAVGIDYQCIGFECHKCMKDYWLTEVE